MRREFFVDCSRDEVHPADKEEFHTLMSNALAEIERDKGPSLEAVNDPDEVKTLGILELRPNQTIFRIVSGEDYQQRQANTRRSEIITLLKKRRWQKLMEQTALPVLEGRRKGLNTIQEKGKQLRSKVAEENLRVIWAAHLDGLSAGEMLRPDNWRKYSAGSWCEKKGAQPTKSQINRIIKVVKEKIEST